MVEVISVLKEVLTSVKFKEKYNSEFYTEKTYFLTFRDSKITWNRLDFRN